jgi:16S rRNA G527 N7-methylase RsmG
LEQAIEHADRFVALVPADATSLIDLGSGGGLPGLVIAWRRRDLVVTLVERRTTRADLLHRAVIALSLGARTTVVAADVASLSGAGSARFDVVTARSFGTPARSARTAASVVRSPGGVVLISEPPVPSADRWSPDVLNSCGLRDDGVHDGIRRLLAGTTRPGEEVASTHRAG